MANNALALRMKYRKFSKEQLEEIVNNEESTELEVKIAQEFLEKMGGETKEKKEAPKKAPKKAPVKKEEEKESEDEKDGDGSPEAAMKRQNKRNSNYQSEEKLTEEEEARLAAAEKEYDKRQKERKTPSKSDKSMREGSKAGKSEKSRETKRQNLEESTEVPGLKVGSKVTLKGSSTVGEVVRLYQSGDGKEKCMVKFGDDKPVKKRATALELAEDTQSAPAKKTPKKK